MATTPKTTGEKLTAVIRGRAEEALKQRLDAYAAQRDRTESFCVRKAVIEFLARNEKRKA